MTFALWCLVIAGLLHIGSKAPLVVAQARSGRGYDNREPRAQQNSLSGWGGRALAAHINQIESFPLFASGILVTLALGLTDVRIDYLAAAYIGSRIIYLFLYVKNIATLRSLVWGVGFISSIALMCAPAWL
ncbi:MAG: MAPEG family protein [Kangiellaceae bacterium]|jgi:uncharacterized MAPEG superfamily protein|nr:MAPEG family protein [Kangiellaceae bacterium]